MDSLHDKYDFCTQLVIELNLSSWDAEQFLLYRCSEILSLSGNLETEGKYSSPMVLIGIYISIASLICVLAMALDLLNGFRTKKFWFPTKYFSLNAASITIINVAMKLPVDLSSPMPNVVDQVAKVGGLAFMCTMISNSLPSLASMDNKSLIANVIGLSILVITVIANIFIQISTRVIDREQVLLYLMPSSTLFSCIYIVMLLFLLMIVISLAITNPTSKKVLESKYQTTSTTIMNYQHPQGNLISTVVKLKRYVKRYLIMAETSSPQFVMTSNPLSTASGIICVISIDDGGSLTVQEKLKHVTVKRVKRLDGSASQHQIRNH